VTTDLEASPTHMSSPLSTSRKKPGAKTPIPTPSGIELGQASVPAAELPGKNWEQLVPEEVYEYAKKRCNGTLPNTLLPSGFRTTDAKILPYLDAVAQGDEEGAIGTLAWQVLAPWPDRIHHEYARWQLTHLQAYGWHYDPPREFCQRADAELQDLVKAWAFGVTGRWIEMKSSHRRRGQTPLLFPYIDGPHEAMQIRAAENFVRLYDDLIAQLKQVSWKSYRNDYRGARSEGQEALVAEVADELKPALQHFEHRWRTGELPPDGVLQAMVRKALRVPKGRNPSETFADEYFGRAEFLIEEKVLRASPSLIRSTRRTLAKRGIRARSRDTDPRSRT
jgi:hypothetical protein